MYTDTSFSHRLRLRFGYRWVEDNTLLPVIKNGRVTTFREPGYHRGAGWTQCYGRAISTALRIPPTIQIDVSATDNLVVSVFLNVKYVFDPRRCVPKIMSGIMTLDASGLNNIVYEHVGRAVRETCGLKTEAELSKGSCWHRLEREIRHLLQGYLAAYGIGIRGQTAVTILNIVPPPEIVRERVMAKVRTIYTDNLQQLPPEIAQNVHEQEIVRHGGFVHVSLGRTPAPPQTNGLPITAVNGTFAHNGHQQHPN